MRGCLAGHNRGMKQLLLVMALLLSGAPGLAHEFTAGTLTIGHPYARPTAPAQPTGAGYLTLVNRGGDDRLVGVSVAPAIAERVEMHSMSMDGNVMRMREVAGIDVPSAQTIELKPGGLHLMFVGLKAPFTVGQRFPVKLKFRQAGEVGVDIHVEAAPAGAAPAHRH